MKYPQIRRRLFAEPWLILPSAYSSLVASFEAHVGQLDKAPRAFFDDIDDGAAADQRPPMADASVAVIEVSGIIGKRLSMMETLCGGCDIDSVRESFAAAVAAPEVSTIIMYMDTPGGQVTGVPEFAEDIYEASMASGKTIIAYTDTLCASAGYYLASQCQQVFASPTAIVGSVGVIRTMVDATEADAKAGLRYTMVKSGQYKDLGSPHRSVSSEEMAMLQGEVDALAQQFFAAVERTRGDIGVAAMQAAVFDGAAAAANGLVDGVYRHFDDMLAALL